MEFVWIVDFKPKYKEINRTATILKFRLSLDLIFIGLKIHIRSTSLSSTKVPVLKQPLQPIAYGITHNGSCGTQGQGFEHALPLGGLGYVGLHPADE